MLDTLPKVRMKLVGADGNAFAIIGRFRDAAKRQGWDADSIAEVTAVAMGGDYNNLLVTILKYVDDSVADEMRDSYYEDDDSTFDNEDEDDDDEY